MTRREYPKNVLGPFYVENDCCTLCGVPEHVAPALFGSDDAHCYVRRQPNSADETTAMLRVLASQELGCVRYRGTDQSLLVRIAEMGEAEVCDNRLPSHVLVKQRVRASFQTRTTLTAAELLTRLLRYLAANMPNLNRTEIAESDHGASVSVSWFEDNYHRIDLQLEEGGDRWNLAHRGPLGLSMTLSDWLGDDVLIAEQDWRDADEARKGIPKKATPW